MVWWIPQIQKQNVSHQPGNRWNACGKWKSTMQSSSLCQVMFCHIAQESCYKYQRWWQNQLWLLDISTMEAWKAFHLLWNRKISFRWPLLLCLRVRNRSHHKVLKDLLNNQQHIHKERVVEEQERGGRGRSEAEETEEWEVGEEEDFKTVNGI